MKEKILVVDDEKDLRLVIADFLVNEGYEVLEADNGQKALEVLEHNEIRCVILDVMMPVMDGWAALRAIKTKYDIPVIMLTARTLIDDEVLGFELGADDYVSKPFVSARLIARIKSVMKQYYRSEDKIFVLDTMRYNKLACVLEIDDKIVELTPKEHELLTYFILNQNIALSRDQLLDHIWGFDYFGDSRTVDTHIKRLRIKLNENAKYIKTVRGLGYRFEVVDG